MWFLDLFGCKNTYVVNTLFFLCLFNVWSVCELLGVFISFERVHYRLPMTLTDSANICLGDALFMCDKHFPHILLKRFFFQHTLMLLHILPYTVYVARVACTFRCLALYSDLLQVVERRRCQNSVLECRQLIGHLHLQPHVLIFFTLFLGVRT